MNEDLQNLILRISRSSTITDFQRRVYSELLKTKIGETLSYAELAKRLGYSHSTVICRAIGQALKRNPWAYGWQCNDTNHPIPLRTDEILQQKELLANCVPCHRVIRSDGSTGGYCGATTGEKIALKEALLQAENQIINNNEN